ncbi:MAG: inositol monophosphatase family protein [Pseudomonadota bacterium]
MTAPDTAPNAPSPDTADLLTDPAQLRLLGLRLADAARLETMARFRRLSRPAENKDADGGYDPVTEADKAAERAIRALLELERPMDRILGEEEDGTGGNGAGTWVIDPIDGTRAYVAGLPTWGTLIAYDDGARGILGVVDHPATGERFIGVAGHGAPAEAEMHQHGDRWPIRVRSTQRLSEAILMSTAEDLFTAEETPGFRRVRDTVQLTRYGGDCYAYAMLAAGFIDVVIESGLQAYDIAAPKALIEAAGGVVTDWEGGDCRWGGRVVAACTPALAEEARRLLAG